MMRSKRLHSDRSATPSAQRGTERLARVGTLWALAVGGCILAAPLPAQAASGGYTAVHNDVFLRAQEYPKDGVVLGHLHCMGCDLSDLAFFGPEGEQVFGELQELRSTSTGVDWAFTPEEEMVPGVHSVTSGGNLEPMFTVLDEFLSVPGAELDFRVSSSSAWPSVVCAKLGPNTPSEEFESEMALDAYLAVQMTGSFVSQFTYRGVANGEETHGGLSAVAWDYDIAPDEICYEVYATPIFGGEEVLVADGCEATGQTDPASWANAEEDREAHEAYLASCEVPSGVEQDAWCEHYRGAVTGRSCEGYDEVPCEEAQDRCAEQFLGTSPGPSAVPESPEEESGGEDVSQEVPVLRREERGESGGGGCSVSSSPTRAAGSWMWLLLLGWGLIPRRRSRR